MRFIVDMNLSPAWCEVLRRAGWDAMHWSTVGPPGATDEEVMAHAYRNGCVVLTHDLDFSAILASTRAGGPSVVQVRTQDVSPTMLGETVVRLLRTHATHLAQGAIISLDAGRARVRILPIGA